MPPGRTSGTNKKRGRPPNNQNNLQDITSPPPQPSGNETWGGSRDDDQDWDNHGTDQAQGGNTEQRKLLALTQRFLDLLLSQNTPYLDIKRASEVLDVPKRRIYDITNALEGVGVISKQEKNLVKWSGSPSIDVSQYYQDLQHLAFNTFQTSNILQGQIDRTLRPTSVSTLHGTTINDNNNNNPVLTPSTSSSSSKDSQNTSTTASITGSNDTVYYPDHSKEKTRPLDKLVAHPGHNKHLVAAQHGGQFRYLNSTEIHPPKPLYPPLSANQVSSRGSSRSSSSSSGDSSSTNASTTTTTTNTTQEQYYHNKLETQNILEQQNKAMQYQFSAPTGQYNPLMSISSPSMRSNDILKHSHNMMSSSSRSTLPLANSIKLDQKPTATTTATTTTSTNTSNTNTNNKYGDQSYSTPVFQPNKPPQPHSNIANIEPLNNKSNNKSTAATTNTATTTTISNDTNNKQIHHQSILQSVNIPSLNLPSLPHDSLHIPSLPQTLPPQDDHVDTNDNNDNIDTNDNSDYIINTDTIDNQQTTTDNNNDIDTKQDPPRSAATSITSSSSASSSASPAFIPPSLDIPTLYPQSLETLSSIHVDNDENPDTPGRLENAKNNNNNQLGRLESCAPSNNNTVTSPSNNNSNNKNNNNNNNNNGIGISTNSNHILCTNSNHDHTPPNDSITQPVTPSYDPHISTHFAYNSTHQSQHDNINSNNINNPHNHTEYYSQHKQQPSSNRYIPPVNKPNPYLRFSAQDIAEGALTACYRLWCPSMDIPENIHSIPSTRTYISPAQLQRLQYSSKLTGKRLLVIKMHDNTQITMPKPGQTVISTTRKMTPEEIALYTKGTHDMYEYEREIKNKINRATASSINNTNIDIKDEDIITSSHTMLLDNNQLQKMKYEHDTIPAAHTNSSNIDPDDEYYIKNGANYPLSSFSDSDLPSPTSLPLSNTLQSSSSSSIEQKPLAHAPSITSFDIASIHQYTPSIVQFIKKVLDVNANGKDSDYIPKHDIVKTEQQQHVVASSQRIDSCELDYYTKQKQYDRKSIHDTTTVVSHDTDSDDNNNNNTMDNIDQCDKVSNSSDTPMSPQQQPQSSLSSPSSPPPPTPLPPPLLPLLPLPPCDVLPLMKSDDLIRKDNDAIISQNVGQSHQIYEIPLPRPEHFVSQAKINNPLSEARDCIGQYDHSIDVDNYLALRALINDNKHNNNTNTVSTISDPKTTQTHNVRYLSSILSQSTVISMLTSSASSYLSMLYTDTYIMSIIKPLISTYIDKCIEYYDIKLNDYYNDLVANSSNHLLDVTTTTTTTMAASIPSSPTPDSEGSDIDLNYDDNNENNESDHDNHDDNNNRSSFTHISGKIKPNLYATNGKIKPQLNDDNNNTKNIKGNNNHKLLSLPSTISSSSDMRINSQLMQYLRDLFNDSNDIPLSILTLLETSTLSTLHHVVYNHNILYTLQILQYHIQYVIRLLLYIKLYTNVPSTYNITCTLQTLLKQQSDKLDKIDYEEEIQRRQGGGHNTNNHNNNDDNDTTRYAITEKPINNNQITRLISPSELLQQVGLISSSSSLLSTSPTSTSSSTIIQDKLDRPTLTMLTRLDPLVDDLITTHHTTINRDTSPYKCNTIQSRFNTNNTGITTTYINSTSHDNTTMNGVFNNNNANSNGNISPQSPSIHKNMQYNTNNSIYKGSSTISTSGLGSGLLSSPQQHTLSYQNRTMGLSPLHCRDYRSSNHHTPVPQFNTNNDDHTMNNNINSSLKHNRQSVHNQISSLHHTNNNTNTHNTNQRHHGLSTPLGPGIHSMTSTPLRQSNTLMASTTPVPSLNAFHQSPFVSNNNKNNQGQQQQQQQQQLPQQPYRHGLPSPFVNQGTITTHSNLNQSSRFNTTAQQPYNKQKMNSNNNNNNTNNDRLSYPNGMRYNNGNHTPATATQHDTANTTPNMGPTMSPNGMHNIQLASNRPNFSLTPASMSSNTTTNNNNTNSNSNNPNPFYTPAISTPNPYLSTTTPQHQNIGSFQHRNTNTANNGNNNTTGLNSSTIRPPYPRNNTNTNNFNMYNNSINNNALSSGGGYDTLLPHPPPPLLPSSSSTSSSLHHVMSSGSSMSSTTMMSNNNQSSSSTSSSSVNASSANASSSSLRPLQFSPMHPSSHNNHLSIDYNNNNNNTNHSSMDYNSNNNSNTTTTTQQQHMSLLSLPLNLSTSHSGAHSGAGLQNQSTTPSTHTATTPVHSGLHGNLHTIPPLHNNNGNGSGSGLLRHTLSVSHNNNNIGLPPVPPSMTKKQQQTRQFQQQQQQQQHNNNMYPLSSSQSLSTLPHSTNTLNSPSSHGNNNDMFNNHQQHQQQQQQLFMTVNGGISPSFRSQSNMLVPGQSPRMLGMTSPSPSLLALSGNTMALPPLHLMPPSQSYVNNSQSQNKQQSSHTPVSGPRQQ